MLIGIQDVNEEFKKRILFWYGKTRKPQKDHWDKFILCWIIFDAYLTEISQLDSDAERLSYFFNNNNDFKNRLQEDRCWNGLLSPYVKKLKGLSPIDDMRPGSSEKRYLNDENSLEEVFRFIYQIRCNLFHGSKNIKDSKDDRLVLNAAKFLEGSLDYIDKWRKPQTETPQTNS